MASDSGEPNEAVPNMARTQVILRDLRVIEGQYVIPCSAEAAYYEIRMTNPIDRITTFVTRDKAVYRMALSALEGKDVRFAVSYHVASRSAGRWPVKVLGQIWVDDDTHS